MNSPRRGFTIVELLIVIVVIGILAVITIVAYTGIRDKAQDSAADSASAQVSKKIRLWQVENPSTLLDCTTFGTLLNATATTNGSVCNLTVGNTAYQYTPATASTFCVTTTVGSASYKVTENTQPSRGGCSGHGQGGVGALTNLAMNPSGIAGMTHWSPWAGNTGGVSSGGAVAEGLAARGKAIRNTWSATNSAYNGDLGILFDNTGTNVLQPNTQYTASWTAITSKAQRLGPNAGNWVISGGSQGSGTGTVNASSGQVTTNATTPVTQWITFTTGPNTIGGKIFSSLVSGTGASYWNAGDWLEVTDFMVVQGGNVPSFKDGDSTDWVWNGTPNNSTSTGPAL